ncbi:hypothetical protein TVAG_277930 [Trichomonas vaginalis G3]|uniref:CS domain-containing protein n=1 Tax=Trichomonas vaginalis (strain ATCC PRA-98 / G3) TaxID=412133 RepID=A2DU34_TRIV3|nr:HCP-like superfamily protein [Trichomonas vaginalis G3]EAY16027.1 hypothetical protein TVAG_277930 [Trichomonas vaginalis G3]KAI5537313.1 HCP-like superfamily protein [Trichomonas vaginalis G3]|eukprot:XP_001328250.1 hypothetical protein [Trichomonas vaginalis G3]
MENAFLMTPKECKSYMWSYKEDEDRLEIDLELNQQEVEKFNFLYNQEQNSLKCTISDSKYPLISGIFYGATRYAEYVQDGTKVIITIKKAEGVNWPYIMKSPIAEDGDLDFNSTFLKFLATQDEQLEVKGKALLKGGFIPAMMYYAQKALDQGNYEEAYAILEPAVYYDGYLPAILLLGEALLDKCPETASRLLQRAHKLGSAKAAQLLGNLNNPLTKYKLEKDYNLAIYYYKYAIEQRDPVSMVSLAQMIEEGLAPETGFTAEKLYEEARAIDPTIVIQKRHGIPFNLSKVGISKPLIVGGAVIAAGFLLYKGIKRFMNHK